MEYTRSVADYSEGRHRLSQSYSVGSSQWSLAAMFNRETRSICSGVANSWCFLN
jgi:hypothetical protein